MNVRAHGKAPRDIRVRLLPVRGPANSFTCLVHVTDEPAVRRADRPRGAEVACSHSPAVGASPLSDREVGILLLISDGYASINIAACLSLSYATVRNHIQNILRKMEVHSQAEAVAIAFRRGWM